MTQHRLLLAIADAELAQSASALAQEGEGLEVVDRIGDAEELSRALRRLEVDVVVLHDALWASSASAIARRTRCWLIPRLAASRSARSS